MAWRFTAALALALIGASASQRSLMLEIRIFDGSEEVTADTRVTVHRAGERSVPIARIDTGAKRIEIEVPEGIYDVQAIREQDGRVLTIRWAERLVVMPYPDEQGRHLEVVNLRSGYGALQVRMKDSTAAPDANLYATGTRDKEAGPRVAGPDYALFVVPAGQYDIRTRIGDRPAWHTGIDVPLDRTRLWLIP